MLRCGKGISKVVLGHGSAGAEWKSSEGCTEAGYPPQHLAAPTSRLGIGYQGVTGGFPPQKLSTASTTPSSRCEPPDVSAAILGPNMEAGAVID